MTAPHDRFDEVYDAWSGLILAYALRRTATPADAADVVAETFTVAWRRMDVLPEGEAARPWLYGVARRVLANHHRADRRRRLLSEKASRMVAQVSFDALDGAEDSPEAAAIAAALDSLREDDRELLLLVGWDGLARDEIAEVLGVSRATVRVRLHRARRRFERELAARGVQRTSTDGHGSGGWASVHLDREDVR